MRRAFLGQGRGEPDVDAMAQRSSNDVLKHRSGAASRDKASGSFDERRIDANLGTNRLDLFQR
jgi:hypothetical protein